MLKIPNLHNWRANLSTEALAKIEKHLTYKTFMTGEVLFATSDIPTHCYQIVSGKIKLSSCNADGREMIVAYFIEGDCFGDVGLFTHHVRQNNFTACGKTKVNLLKKSDLENIIEIYPEVLWAMYRQASYRLDYFFNIIGDSSLLSLYERLATVLVKLGGSTGEKDQQGRTFIADISQENMARMTGSTRQSVGRELKRMKGEGLIIIEYSKITLCNIDSMSEKYDKLTSNEIFIPDYSHSKNN